MKVVITLLILGVAGVGQYVYFQLTPLAYNYSVYESGGLVHVIATRNWTVGLMGAVIGMVLLGLGIYRYRHRKIPS